MSVPRLLRAAGLLAAGLFLGLLGFLLFEGVTAHAAQAAETGTPTGLSVTVGAPASGHALMCPMDATAGCPVHGPIPGPGGSDPTTGTPPTQPPAAGNPDCQPGTFDPVSCLGQGIPGLSDTPPAVPTDPTPPALPTTPTQPTPPAVPTDPSLPTRTLPTPPAIPTATLAATPTPPDATLPTSPTLPAATLPTPPAGPSATLPTPPTPPTETLPAPPAPPTATLPTPPAIPTVTLPATPTPPDATLPSSPTMPAASLPATPTLPTGTTPPTPPDLASASLPSAPPIPPSTQAPPWALPSPPSTPSIPAAAPGIDDCQGLPACGVPDAVSNPDTPTTISAPDQTAQAEFPADPTATDPPAGWATGPSDTSATAPDTASPLDLPPSGQASDGPSGLADLCSSLRLPACPDDQPGAGGPAPGTGGLPGWPPYAGIGPELPPATAETGIGLPPGPGPAADTSMALPPSEGSADAPTPALTAPDQLPADPTATDSTTIPSQVPSGPFATSPDFTSPLGLTPTGQAPDGAGGTPGSSAMCPRRWLSGCPDGLPGTAGAAPGTGGLPGWPPYAGIGPELPPGNDGGGLPSTTPGANPWFPPATGPTPGGPASPWPPNPWSPGAGAGTGEPHQPWIHEPNPAGLGLGPTDPFGLSRGLGRMKGQAGRAVDWINPRTVPVPGQPFFRTKVVAWNTIPVVIESGPGWLRTLLSPTAAGMAGIAADIGEIARTSMADIRAARLPLAEARAEQAAQDLATSQGKTPWARQVGQQELYAANQDLADARRDHIAGTRQSLAKGEQWLRDETVMNLGDMEAFRDAQHEAPYLDDSDWARAYGWQPGEGDLDATGGAPELTGPTGGNPEPTEPGVTEPPSTEPPSTETPAAGPAKPLPAGPPAGRGPATPPGPAEPATEGMADPFDPDLVRETMIAAHPEYDPNSATLTDPFSKIIWASRDIRELRSAMADPNHPIDPAAAQAKIDEVRGDLQRLHDQAVTDINNGIDRPAKPAIDLHRAQLEHLAAQLNTQPGQGEAPDGQANKPGENGEAGDDGAPSGDPQRPGPGPRTGPFGGAASPEPAPGTDPAGPDGPLGPPPNEQSWNDPRGSSAGRLPAGRAFEPADPRSAGSAVDPRGAGSTVTEYPERQGLSLQDWFDQDIGVTQDPEMNQLKARYLRDAELAKRPMAVQGGWSTDPKWDPDISKWPGIEGRFTAVDFPENNLLQVTIPIELRRANPSDTNLKSIPDPSTVSDEDLERIKYRAQLGVDRLINSQNELLPNGRQLNIRLEFHDNPDTSVVRPHTVRLLPGNGRSNARTWHIKSPPNVLAHETLHLSGLLDSYQENGFILRQDPDSAGIEDPRYIMANTRDMNVRMSPKNLYDLLDYTQQYGGVVTDPEDTGTKTPADPGKAGSPLRNLAARTRDLFGSLKGAWSKGTQTPEEIKGSELTKGNPDNLGYQGGDKFGEDKIDWIKAPGGRQIVARPTLLPEGTKPTAIGRIIKAGDYGPLPGGGWGEWPKLKHAGPDTTTPAADDTVAKATGTEPYDGTAVPERAPGEGTTSRIGSDGPGIPGSPESGIPPNQQSPDDPGSPEPPGRPDAPGAPGAPPKGPTSPERPGMPTPPKGPTPAERPGAAPAEPGEPTPPSLSDSSVPVPGGTTDSFGRGFLRGARQGAVFSLISIAADRYLQHITGDYQRWVVRRATEDPAFTQRYLDQYTDWNDNQSWLDHRGSDVRHFFDNGVDNIDSSAFTPEIKQYMTQVHDQQYASGAPGALPPRYAAQRAAANDAVAVQNRQPGEQQGIDQVRENASATLQGKTVQQYEADGWTDRARANDDVTKTLQAHNMTPEQFGAIMAHQPGESDADYDNRVGQQLSDAGISPTVPQKATVTPEQQAAIDHAVALGKDPADMPGTPQYDAAHPKPVDPLQEQQVDQSEQALRHGTPPNRVPHTPEWAATHPDALTGQTVDAAEQAYRHQQGPPAPMPSGAPTPLAPVNTVPTPGPTAPAPAAGPASTAPPADGGTVQYSGSGSEHNAVDHPHDPPADGGNIHYSGSGSEHNAQDPHGGSTPPTHDWGDGNAPSPTPAPTDAPSPTPGPTAPAPAAGPSSTAPPSDGGTVQYSGSGSEHNAVDHPHDPPADGGNIHYSGSGSEHNAEDPHDPGTPPSGNTGPPAGGDGGAPAPGPSDPPGPPAGGDSPPGPPSGGDNPSPPDPPRSNPNNAGEF